MSLRRLRAAARFTALAVGLAVGLAGCSSGDFGGGSPLVEGAKLAAGLVMSGATRTGAGGGGSGGVPQGLSRAALKGVEGPLLLASIEKTGAAATLKLARRNGAYATFASPDLLTMTFRDGVLSASRGMAGDLLAGETDATLAALRGRRAARYEKALRFIGGDRQILLSRLTCTTEVVGPETVAVLEVPHATTHMAEICSGGSGDTLRNDYWIGADQVIWKSRQFLHPIMGYVTIERLLR